MFEHVFPGKSEMARRMRELDWSKTPLGSVENWPQSLRTSVSTCLNCAFPIVVWWGPDLAILYNDEYRAILGAAKHPAALGERGAKVWAEIWDVIAPMLSQVMGRAEETRSRDLLLHIDREGYPEEAYFSFSYAPIHDEEGKVGGIFCPVIETTEKVIGERRLRTLRDLAARRKGALDEGSAYDAAASVLESNPHDVPFAMIYRVDEARSIAVLDAAAGLKPGVAAAPLEVPLVPDDAGIWSLASVARGGSAAVLTDLANRFERLPTGAWATPPHSALVLPILLPGQERPRAILVAAVSPMRALDEDYRTFFSLVATQIASGLADAQALEEERRRAEALAEIDRAKTAFFSNVSHEFRTPLTLMLGPLEDALANAYGTLPKEAALALGAAHRNSLRLLRLVNTLLDFSRIEAGRVEASFEPSDLSTLTGELASVFRSAIEKANLRLVVDCPPLRELAYVDRDMWEKIVLNLLSNALKFTFEGTIKVALRSNGKRIELLVSDTGVGIPEADLPKMFQRFHRVKNTRSRTHEGTGIGLALVQELVRLHGGEVSVESQEGRGTTFRVLIPTGNEHLPADRIGAPRTLVSTSLDAAPFIEEALRWIPEEGNADGECANDVMIDPSDVLPVSVPRHGEPRARVLVVDDNADMRDYLRRLLDRSFEVVTAADGQDALEKIRADRPDLVLSDVMMPRLDGFGLLAALRADERTRTLPFIMLSARAGEESRIEGLSAGASDYLIKPFSARELLARVASQLELARLRREADRSKDEFLATLAHELRNPLAPIRNSLHVLRLSGDKRAEPVHDMIERQVNHMVRLVDDLMEISRITRGKIELRKEQVDLATIVRSACETSKPLVEGAHHQLVVHLPTEPLILDADPVRLAQVLSNLLNNAAKYTEDGGRISLSAQREGSDVVVSVRDSGMGIPVDVLPKVFDMFMQVERGYSRAQGGLGIGLTLVRSLVELHGGSVSARSDGPGRGSEFVVRLPLVKARRISQERERPADRPSAVAQRRILVVDDNQDAADSLGMLLRCLGADVFTASDGPTALEALQTYRPSIVVLDIGLPGMDGYEVARRARQRPEGRDLTLIALTGWGQQSDRRRSREAGIDHHLIKPIELGALEKVLSLATSQEARSSHQ